MKKTQHYHFLASGIIFLLFVIYTLCLGVLDLQPIGPHHSVVGFARLNQAFHQMTGVHMGLYTITDWLSLFAVFIALFFAFLGLFQWVKRKSLWKVDINILTLGIFYCLVIAAYLFFEIVVINYRPVLIGNILEASFPSSTTLLIMCIIPTAMLQVNWRLKSAQAKCSLNLFLLCYLLFMVIGRVLSGVHWLTDIIGGLLLSSALILFYTGLTFTWQSHQKK